MTTKKFTGDETIGEIMGCHPQSAEILFDAGLGCAMCPHAQYESLIEGCQAHGFDDEEIKIILEELNSTLDTE